MYGTYRYLDSMRSTLSRARATVARLTAQGIEPREYIRIASDAEYSMNAAIITLRVYKQRYAESVAAYRLLTGPRLPREDAPVTWRAAA